jgi:hypothetical protein
MIHANDTANTALVHDMCCGWFMLSRHGHCVTASFNRGVIDVQGLHADHAMGSNSYKKHIRHWNLSCCKVNCSMLGGELCQLCPGAY